MCRIFIVVNIGELLSLQELRNDLLRVDEALRRSVISEDPFLSEVSAHLITAGGKRLRPSMAIAAALTGTTGPVPQGVILGGAAVELVHLGSLYHDDVLDEAQTRRTVPSVNARYGNFMAIIAGDYLLARASGIAATLGTEITALLAETIAQLCEGQVWEQRYSFDVERPISAYNSCISGKTASLIASSCRIGAIAANLPHHHIEALTTFGHSFGMAFQVRDDILDVIGTDEQLGKPAGNDLVEGVYTLPVIYTLEHPEVGNDLKALLGEELAMPDRDKARDIVRSVGVTKAIDSGKNWALQAVDAISILDASSMTNHLIELAESMFNDLSRD